MAARRHIENILDFASLIKSREEELLKIMEVQIKLCQYVLSPVTAIIRPALEIVKRLVYVS